MRNDKRKPDGRRQEELRKRSVGKDAGSSRTQSSKILSFAILTSVFLSYFAWFLLQPSWFLAESEEGGLISRLSDLIILPSLAAHTLSAFPGSLDRIPILLATLAWMAIAGWIGWPFVRQVVGVHWRGTQKSSRSLRLIAGSLSILVGLALLSTSVMLLGTAGLLQSRIPLLVGIGVLLGLAETLRRARSNGPTVALAAGQIEARKTDESDRNPEQHEEAFRLEPDSVGALWMLRLLPVMTWALAAYYVWGSMVPAWEFDVLEYHLQAPKEFYQAGQIRFVDHNVYANMPLGVEMHSLAAMVLHGGELGWWYGGLVGKTITGIHALLLAALVGGFVSRRLGSYLGWASAGLILAMPGNAHVSFAGLVDTALAAYVTGAILSFGVGRRGGVPAPSANRGLLIGILAGAAVACKYPGLVFAVLPASLLLGAQALKARRHVAGAMMCFGLGLCVTCLPWFLKNAVQTGNPVYPLAYSLFGGRGLTEEQVARWDRVHSPQAKSEVAPYSLQALVRDTKQVVVKSPFVSPSLNFLAALAVLVGIGGRGRKHILLLSLCVLWIFGVWWFATHRIDRFWLPAVPLLAMLAAVGAEWLANRVSVPLAASVLFLGVGFGLLQILSGVGPLDARVFEPIATFERQTLEEDPYGAVNPTMAWINRNLDSQDKVLSIGEVKAYLYRVPLVYATCFNDAPGEAWLRGKTPREQQKELQKQGVTYVMVDWYEIERYRSPGNYGFSSWPQHRDFEAMVTGGVLEPVDHPFPLDRVEIFRVRNSDIADPSE